MIHFMPMVKPDATVLVFSVRLRCQIGRLR